jgi:hypothetical protein
MDQRRWLHYMLLAVTFVCSLVSLFALVVLGSPSWTNSINGLGLVCLLLALRFRPAPVNADDQ